MNIPAIIENFKKRGYDVAYFETKEEAAAYLNAQIDGVTVASGGSMTVAELGLAETLAAHNTFYSHANPPAGMTAEDVRRAAMTTDVYLTSANATAPQENALCCSRRPLLRLQQPGTHLQRSFRSPAPADVLQNGNRSHRRERRLLILQNRTNRGKAFEMPSLNLFIEQTIGRTPTQDSSGRC